MNKIKSFVEQNTMSVTGAIVMVVFSMWMYSAHQNMIKRDIAREARINEVIANGGTHHPADDLAVSNTIVAECCD